MFVRRSLATAVAVARRPSRRTSGHAARLGAMLALAAGLPLGGTACVPPKTPIERLTDAAYELNVATRFGRLDVAIPYVAPDVQPEFARNHAHWMRQIRVVDMDLVGITPLAGDAVAVDVVISWHPLDETMIRQSQISQRWVLEEDDWRLTEERRSGGDPGLFPSDSGKPRTEVAANKVDPSPPSAKGGESAPIP